MAFGETCLLIKEFVANHLLATLRQLALEVVRAGADLLEVARHVDVRRGVGRYLHMPVETAMFLFPTTHNLAVNRGVTGIDLVDLVDGEIRRHLDVSETQITDTDAGNVFIEPREQVAEQHHVVAAVHRGRGGVAVPEFPDGGGAVLGHIAPRGILLVCGEEPGEVGAMHETEGMHKPAGADDAGGDGAEVLVDEGLHDLLLYLMPDIETFIGALSHFEYVRQHIGRDGIVAVIDTVGIENMTGNGRGAFLHGEELAVEGFLCECHLVIKPFLVCVLSHNQSKILHHLTHLIVVGRRDERNIGDTCRVFAVDEILTLRRHAPVAVFAAIDDAVALVLRL